MTFPCGRLWIFLICFLFFSIRSIRFLFKEDDNTMIIKFLKNFIASRVRFHLTVLSNRYINFTLYFFQVLLNSLRVFLVPRRYVVVLHKYTRIFPRFCHIRTQVCCFYWTSSKAPPVFIENPRFSKLTFATNLGTSQFVRTCKHNDWRFTNLLTTFVECSGAFFVKNININVRKLKQIIIRGYGDLA